MMHSGLLKRSLGATKFSQPTLHALQKETITSGLLGFIIGIDLREAS